jgi:hypothetical protein
MVILWAFVVQKKRGYRFNLLVTDNAPEITAVEPVPVIEPFKPRRHLTVNDLHVFLRAFIGRNDQQTAFAGAIGFIDDFKCPGIKFFGEVIREPLDVEVRVLFEALKEEKGNSSKLSMINIHEIALKSLPYLMLSQLKRVSIKTRKTGTR